jgi:hypothetical protein
MLYYYYSKRGGLIFMGSNKTLLGRSVVDSTGKTVVTSTNLHAHIHAGKAYRSRISNASVANDGHLYAEVIIPEGVWMHLKNLILYSSGDEMDINITENPDAITDGTTPAVIRNFNRSPKYNDDPKGIQIFSDPSGMSGGTELDDYQLGGGVGAGDAIGSGSLQNEWLLPPGHKLIIDLTNTSGTVQGMYILLIFYIS